MGRVHQPSRVAASSHRSLPVRWWWLALLGLLVVIAVVVNRPAGAPPLVAPTAVTAAQLAATPDLHLIYTATNDLRWRLLLAPNQQTRWRELGPAARTVLALAWVEEDLADPNARPLFTGFGDLLSIQAPNMATLEDIAVGYEAIGAPVVASIVREAAAIPRSPAEPPTALALQPTDKTATADPYADCNRRFTAQARHDGTVAKLRAFIRAHTAELTAGPE
jgi:hypothetical protein